MKQPILMQGDCIKKIGDWADNSIHAVCTDPPYGLVEFSPDEVAKLRSGKGGVWRLPPKWDGCERRPLPRFTILSQEQKKEIEAFFRRWALVLLPKLRPGAHVVIAGNSVLQMYVQNAMVAEGFENRGTILRLYMDSGGVIGQRTRNGNSPMCA